MWCCLAFVRVKRSFIVELPGECEVTANLAIFYADALRVGSKFADLIKPLLPKTLATQIERSVGKKKGVRLGNAPLKVYRIFQEGKRGDPKSPVVLDFINKKIQVRYICSEDVTLDMPPALLDANFHDESIKKALLKSNIHHVWIDLITEKKTKLRSSSSKLDASVSRVGISLLLNNTPLDNEDITLPKDPIERFKMIDEITNKLRSIALKNNALVVLKIDPKGITAKSELKTLIKLARVIKNNLLWYGIPTYVYILNKRRNKK